MLSELPDVAYEDSSEGIESMRTTWWSDFEIVDAHAHLRNPTPEFNVSLTADGLRKLMREYNYSKAIIMARDNTMIAKAVKNSRDLCANVWVNPKDEHSKREVTSFLKRKNFIGVKLHPLFDGYTPDSLIVNPIAKIAEKMGVPLQIHCGHSPFSLPWSFEPLARRFPDLKIVLVHMGHGHIVYINGAIEVAARNRNIYLETSGMPMHTKIKEAIERVGRDRVMYGDDAPFGHPSWELEKARASGLGNSDLQRLLSTNVKRLYSLD